MTTDPFRSMVRAEGARLYRDLPWRRTRDAYGIWISEVMLQQTQVVRVLDRWPAWLERFPSVHDLATAEPAEVLEAWQGMGYNRRALALHRAAKAVVEGHDGVFPCETAALTALPGIGPATAQGIRAFAFDLPGVYLETNVRTVFLHHFFPEVEKVPDRELIPLVEAACPGGAGCSAGLAPQDACGVAACRVEDGRGGALLSVDGAPGESAADGGAADGQAPGVELADDAVAGSPYACPQDELDTPRSWYYALLDYGAYLKKTIPNPSRRSKSYARQSKFEGSRRQKRSELVRMLLAAGPAGLTGEDALRALNDFEAGAGREPIAHALVRELLEELEREGFCKRNGDVWVIA